MPPEKQAFQALETLYRRVNEALQPQAFDCRRDGECCRFERSGHRLYVTRLEADYLVHCEGVPPAPARAGRCPFQEGDLCLAREGRPLGCRLYYCDPDRAEWIGEQYERFHEKIVALHQRFGIRYEYRPLPGHPVFTEGGETEPAPSPDHG